MKKFFNKEYVTKELKSLKPLNFLILIVAGLIDVIGVNLMLAPLKFLDGGFSGLAEYLSIYTSPYLIMAAWLLIFNVPIFILGARKQGLAFIIYSIWGIGMYSLWSFLFVDVFPIDLSTSPIVGSDMILAAIFGGLLSGIGTGLNVRFGGALDGTDVIAILLSKKIGLSIGNIELIFNIIMFVTIASIERSYTIPLYSLIAYFVNVKTVDLIVTGLDQGQAANIVTSKGQEVSKALSEGFGRGLTIIDAKGYYSDAHKTLIYCAVNRFEIPRLKKKVKEIDPDAFISITSTSDALPRKKAKRSPSFKNNGD